MTSSELIAEAARLWAGTKRGYRDGAIAVGRLLKEFVRRRLEESAGLSERARQLAENTREGVVATAAAALNLPASTVRKLIRAGAVDELLRPDGGWGDLSLTAVAALCPLVSRPNRGRAAPVAWRVRGGNPSDQEEWSVARAAAPAIAARAASEGWLAVRVREEVTGGPPKPAPKYARPTRIAAGPGKYTTGKVAKLFNVAPRTAVKWMDAGRIKSYRIPGSLDRRTTPEALVSFCLSSGLPIPSELERSVSVAFGVDSVLVPEGIALLDSFELGRACGLKTVALCLVGDEDGLHRSALAGAFVRAAFPRARIVLILSEGNAGFVPPPGVFSDVVGLPADLSFLANTEVVSV